ncbi:MAG TPA: inositol 2-dehydrogenase [Gaiellaceae bacterium]|nr:inositol 2-dehydrogenase [Gaiellaceae bacterium]
MSAPIRVGLLGVGRIGRLHARLLAREVPGLQLSAVYDVDQAAAAAVGRHLAVPVVSSSEELFESAETDALAICTSTDTHVEMLIGAAAYGKPVFLEKPVSLDLAELDRGIAAVEGGGVFVHVGFNRRFDPAHASVRHSISAGDIGELHLVRISSRDPAPPPVEYVRVSGGIFLDMTVHDFDMARFVTDAEVTDVFALGDVRIDRDIADAGDLDTAVVTLRHANRVLTVIDNSRRAVYGFDQRVEAFGSAGMAASHNPLAHTGTVTTAAGTKTQPLPHFFTERYVPSYVAQWTAFEEAVRAGEAPPVTVHDGRAALVVGLAAWRSAREGRPVRTAEIA